MAASVSADDRIPSISAARPTSPDELVARGEQRLSTGTLRSAESDFRRALSLDGRCASAHVGLAACLLARGEWDEGFREWEWRLEADPPSSLAGLPPWRGEPLSGRRLLLAAEQGHGDTVQFVRFARTAADAGARVVLACQPGLVRLLQGVAGVERVVPITGAAPTVDFAAPLMSCPHLLALGAETVRPVGPYLAPPADARRAWRRRVARAGPGFRVAIAWQGNPAFPGDSTRSVPFECLRPLLELRGVRFFSVQVGPGRDALARSPLRGAVVDLADLIGDFSDTAALLMEMDLVVTSDSAVAHLAGALGVPALVALRHRPDWRWLPHRSRTPWYPGLRLFRQPEPGGWDACLAGIARAVAERVPSTPSPPMRFRRAGTSPRQDAAVRALDWLATGMRAIGDPPPGAWPWERVKSIAEVLLACEVCERSAWIPPAAVRALREPILRQVSSEAFLGMVLRDPWLCRLTVPVLAMAQRCGAAPPGTGSRVRRLLDTGYLDAVERTPFQDMEVQFYLEMGGYRAAGVEMEALYARTLAGRMRSPLHLSEHDCYAVTHALFYLARFGMVPPERVRAHAGIGMPAALELLLGRYVRERHWDLAGELLICHALLGIGGSAVQDLAWEGLLEAQREDGCVQGRSFDPASPRMADPVSAAAYRWECNAHPTLVAAMACALA